MFCHGVCFCPKGKFYFNSFIKKMSVVKINSESENLRSSSEPVDEGLHDLDVLQPPSEFVEGPHNLDVISALVGLLLGSGFVEKQGESTCVCVWITKQNTAYLRRVHRFLFERGYCLDEVPDLNKQIGPEGQVYWRVQFRTFSFKSFNFLQSIFYREVDGKKIVPDVIEELLTPYGLAVWYMNDGAAHNTGGCILSTNAFSLADCEKLQLAL